MNILKETGDAIADMLRRGMPMDEIMYYYHVPAKVVERIDRERRRAESKPPKLHQTRVGKTCKRHNCYLPCVACRALPYLENKLACKRAMQGAK